MVLYINSAKDKELSIFLGKQKEIIDKIALTGDFKISEHLAGKIQALLLKNKIDFRKLRGIIIVKGPGHFTAIRIAAAVGNTLAYVLNIPIVGITYKENSSDIDLYEQGIKLLKKSPQKNIMPLYGQKPNISR